VAPQGLKLAGYHPRLSIIGGGTILGGLVGIAMYVKHRSRRDAVTPAGDDYHRITEPQ
jgi:hypothetical protein